MSLREGFSSLICSITFIYYFPIINLDGNDQGFLMWHNRINHYVCIGLISIIGTMSLIPNLYQWPETKENNNPFKETQKTNEFR
ncbi:MAG: hypothetical protein CM15mP127_13730 [Gammaproteobacteria bacterium]|nr:MAG: hypothetical protein CM15mP127_13730 [Gammaproteobacteria bacterium]